LTSLSATTPLLDPLRGLIERWYDAYTRRDLEVMCQVADNDIQIVSRGDDERRLAGATFRGRDGVRTLMQWAFDLYPGARVTALKTRRMRHAMLARTVYENELPGRPLSEFVSFTLFDGGSEGIVRIRTFRDEPAAVESAEADVLSARERQVLRLLANGLNARQVADELVLSPATVRTHVRNAMLHLQARTRVEATALALQRGDI
jgi:DNA-binding CsgD family transcriptional regulator